MTIQGTAEDTLEALVATFAAAEVDLPERRYVTQGDVAADCEQLVVAVTRIYSGVPGAEMTGPDLAECRGPRVQVMNASLFRCVPTVDLDAEEYVPPSVDDLEASAVVLNRDAGIMVDSFVQYLQANRSEWSDRRAWRVGALDSYGPEGGLAGWTLAIEVQV